MTLFAPPVLVAGPCVLEHEALNLQVAERLAELGVRLGVRVIFKASYLKANRARPDAPRGPGRDAGLLALARVRDATGLPILTDIHESGDAVPAAAVCDALQIPALLARQTVLIEAAAATGRPLNLKKGPWMAPEEMAGAVAKAREAGATDIAVTERGTAFGYGDLVVDMRSFARLRAATRAPVLFDATHAVQQPGRGPGGASAGQRDHVPALLAAAAAAGCDGFFVETHPDPARAPSDGATMWPLAALEGLIERALAVWHASRESEARRA